MSLHDYPRCFGCVQEIEYNPVYAAPCDHERCPSVVWHGVCLMRHRESVERRENAVTVWIIRHTKDRQ